MKPNILAAALLVTITFSAKTYAQATPGVTKDQVTQQARIQEGKKDGEITRRENRQLQRQQARIQKTKQVAKADGVVTPQERRALHKQQRRASKNIYHQKHDAQTK